MQSDRVATPSKATQGVRRDGAQGCSYARGGMVLAMGLLCDELGRPQSLDSER